MKRFTETEKWRDAWFRRLTPVQKCLWFYLVDNCDAAGVIDLDVELASFQIGATITGEDLLALDKQLRTLPSGKLWLPKFVRFQYGKLSRQCLPHSAVFNALERAGIDLSKLEEKGSDVLPFPKGSPTLEEKEEEKEKEKGKETTPVSGSRRGPAQAELIQPFDVFTHYPNKIGQNAALRAIKLAFKRADPLTILDATRRYAATVSRWPASEHRFVPSGAKWFTEDRFLDPPESWERKPAGNTRIAATTEAAHARGF